MSKNVNNLEGKHVVVTGASRGLGSVCVKVLADHDAHIVLMARSEEKLEAVRLSSINPEKHLSIPLDLTDMGQLNEGIKKAKEFLGNIDIVLHVIGGGLGLRDALLSSEDFIKLFTLNVVAAAEINRIVVPEMVKNGKGNLVHIGSIASSEATASVGYNTVKAALAAYVRSLGREIAGSGVVATGILPGGFYAPGNSWERLEATRPEVVKQFIEERLPRKFLGRAEELIPIILLLCSDAASMMGGCLIPIDAGEGKAYLTND
ncbi:SDR family oxidoreductase [Candidatus Peregrinibacteria bacterium]|nr:SDR family oxidoreductase [Candidatus Peregrinibacteria bacterium]